MTYDSIQRISEFDMPATESKRPARRSRKPAKGLRVWEARQTVKKVARGSKRLIGGLRG